jgi:hypothetical protein
MGPFEVIIPVRNGGAALQNSIQSLRAGLCSGNVHLTISDNYSTDGTPWRQTLETLPGAQWRVIQPPEPLGRVEHWSWAFGQAEAPWLKPLMAGDRVHDAFWTWAQQASWQFPEAGLLFSAASLIDPAAAHPQHTHSPTCVEATRIYDRKEFSRDAVRCRNRIGALSQVLLRSSITRAALPFEPAFAWTADWRFYRRCLDRTTAVETRSRLVTLDRSIARLSTSWKGLRGSFREDWRFAAEQARLDQVAASLAFGYRSQAIGTKFLLLVGRKTLPRGLRGFLTSTFRLHRKPVAA